MITTASTYTPRITRISTEPTPVPKVSAKSNRERTTPSTVSSFKETTRKYLLTTSSVFTVTPRPIKIEESYGKSSPPTIANRLTEYPVTSLPEDTVTHKRRKHKHKKNKHNKNRKSTTPAAINDTTVATIKTNIPTQSNNEVNTQRNITSSNKTAGKAENAADVQYTVIDTPVQEGNAKSRAAHHVISHGTTLLQTMFMLCSLFALYL